MLWFFHFQPWKPQNIIANHRNFVLYSQGFFRGLKGEHWFWLLIWLRCLRKELSKTAFTFMDQECMAAWASIERVQNMAACRIKHVAMRDCVLLVILLSMGTDSNDCWYALPHAIYNLMLMASLPHLVCPRNSSQQTSFGNHVGIVWKLPTVSHAYRNQN